MYNIFWKDINLYILTITKGTWHGCFVRSQLFKHKIHEILALISYHSVVCVYVLCYVVSISGLLIKSKVLCRQWHTFVERQLHTLEVYKLAGMRVPNVTMDFAYLTVSIGPFWANRCIWNCICPCVLQWH